MKITDSNNIFEHHTDPNFVFEHQTDSNIVFEHQPDSNIVFKHQILLEHVYYSVIVFNTNTNACFNISISVNLEDLKKEYSLPSVREFDDPAATFLQ